MDLRIGAEGASSGEIEAIDACLQGREPRGERHLLLPLLRAVQERSGWIGAGALNEICRRLEIPPAEAYGVATFYAMLSVSPRPPRVAHVCDDIACRLRGAESLCAQMQEALGPEGKPAGGDATWLRSPCLGLCEQAPAALVTRAGPSPSEQALGSATAGGILEALRGRPAGIAATSHPSVPQAGGPGLRLLRRIGRIDPERLDDYRSRGGYLALRRAARLGPAGVIREVSDSKLVGRGGAAFPTGRKWEAVARAPVQPHYLVCNADESEPGTFKDRILMEEDPCALVEAMTIAGFAVGARRGYIYIRGEYPLAARRMGHAIAEARSRGLLGPDVMGLGFAFDVELRRGAGAYICGEETALFNSIEGLRGEPRNKPPFPVDKGLFGLPTAINNVETLVNVLEVILEGGPAYAAAGTTDSTGTKLFCVSGSVRTPGLYEVPFGVTLRELVEMAGGVAGEKRLQAILVGGAAGAFVTPAEIDVPLTFEGLRAVKASLGSGVVMVFDETADMRDIVLRIARFFRDESCGQCVPCRVGTARQEELLHRLASGRPLGSASSERALLGEIGQAMRDASICGLGQTASSAVESALAKLPALAGGGA